jgi:hypothetical protein
MTTANLSGTEIPQQGLGSTKIIRRKFNNKKKQIKLNFLKKLNEKNGNYDFWNDPSQIGPNWKKAYPILYMARKSNYFDTTKGQGGKFPGFFHYMKSRKNK